MGKRTASAAQLKPQDYRLLAEFRRLLRQFLVFSEQQALGVGLAPQQHQALLAIKGAPDGSPTVGDLAERLAIRHNSAVGLINRLVGAGYVRRCDDPSDKRRATLALTKAGEAILMKLTADHSKVDRPARHRLVPVPVAYNPIHESVEFLGILGKIPRAERDA
jgi:DNA-binding MarR family transcriptional regulator